MNTKRLVLAGLAASALILAGCSGTGGTRGSGQGAEVVNGSGSGSGAVTQGASGGTGWNGTALTADQQQLLSEHVIHFDFDKSAIKPEYIPLLKAHAQMLNANPSQHVTVEGHTDERGTREYNIGLGERRAKAVEQFLEAEGVNPSQINTISYGEERPVALGHNEAAWAQNRRAVLDD